MAATSIKEKLQQREARVGAIEVLARKHDITLPELARTFDISEYAAWALVQTLLRRKLIRRSGLRYGGKGHKGRPATLFRHVDVPTRGTR